MKYSNKSKKNYGNNGTLNNGTLNNGTLKGP